VAALAGKGRTAGSGVLAAEPNLCDPSATACWTRPTCGVPQPVQALVAQEL